MNKTDVSDYKYITDARDLKKWLGCYCGPGTVVSVDTETTSVKPMEAAIVGISLCAIPGQAIYIPISHNKCRWNMRSALSVLEPMLSNPKVYKVGQNIKYDVVVLRNHGVRVFGVTFDTMIASYLLDANLNRAHNLDALAKRYLNIETIKYKDVVPKKSTFQDVDVESATYYAGEDVDVVLQLYPILHSLVEEEGLLPLMENVDLPLSHVIADMEFKGVRFDRRVSTEIDRDVMVLLRNLELDVYEAAGDAFNINSSQQLAGVLYDTLGIECKKTTPKGARSTSKTALEMLSHPVAEKLLQYREMFKLRSAFLEKLPTHIIEKTGRIHPSYNQCRTKTGRLSCSEPNIQQIPSRGEMGQLLRKAFAPQKDWLMVGADYSQIELRMFAHLSQDQELIAIYNEGRDVHEATAEAVGCTRAHAKTINFGILYGMGGYRLSKELGVSVNLGYRYLDKFFKKYSGVKAYIEHVREMCYTTLHAKTYLGRRLYLPDVRSENEKKAEAAFRQAVSVAVQGSAADLIRVAMINVWARIKEEGMESNLVLSVHDELNFECPEDEVDGLVHIIKHEMTTAWELSVPLEINLKVGGSWYEVH